MLVTVPTLITWTSPWSLFNMKCSSYNIAKSMWHWLPLFRKSKVSSTAGFWPLYSQLAPAGFTGTNRISKYTSLNVAYLRFIQKDESFGRRVSASKTCSDVDAPSFQILPGVQERVKLSMWTQPIDGISKQQGSQMWTWHCSVGFSVVIPDIKIPISYISVRIALHLGFDCPTMPVHSGRYYFLLDLLRSWRRTTSQFNIINHKAS